MARIRTIKPEYWSSEQVMECSTNARLLFIGLWNFCDDAGRMPYKPRQIKAQIFPGDDFSSETILGILRELEANELIGVYRIDEQQYLQVTGWHHQRIDKPQPPKCPAPIDPIESGSKNDPGTLPPDTILKDTKGKKDITPNSSKEDLLAIPTSLSRTKAIESDFDEWYADYPLKVGKGQARKAYRLARKKTNQAGLVAGVKAYRRNKSEYADWAQPATWLNGERWEDEAKPNGEDKVDPDKALVDKAAYMKKFLGPDAWSSNKPFVESSELRTMVERGLLTQQDADEWVR